jgi:hypothetical protein
LVKEFTNVKSFLEYTGKTMGSYYLSCIDKPKVFEFFKHNIKYGWFIQRTSDLICDINPLLTNKLAPIIVYCYYYKSGVLTFDVYFKSISSMQKSIKNNKDFYSIKKALDSNKIFKCQFDGIIREWILSSKKF